MESKHHVPTNSNGERALNIQGASSSEEVLSKESYGPNNKPVISYHRRYPDGKYVAVILSQGYGFNPQDDQLIVDYLNKEINKEEAPYICIPKVNVYTHTPEELAESHASSGEDEWYFFSPRDRKYLNGSRPNRAAGNGYWKATGADKKIYRDGKSVGSKKCLVFYQGKPKQSNKTTWIMHEYVADRPQRPRRLPNGTDDMRLDDCVLCRIYKKSEHSPKEEKEAGASESGETAKPEARKSSENNKQAVPKRVKTEHEGTNQQLNLLVLHRNLQMQQQDHPVTQPSLPRPQLNPQEIMQYSPQPWSDNNLGGQLDFSPESNPEEAQPIMQQPNIQGASEEVLSKESYGPNNEPVISYHRRYPDGKYVPVMLSPGYGFNPQDDQLIVDYLNKEINKEEAPYVRIPKVNVYDHTPEELAESHASSGEDEWHFFSPRDRKYLNGSRPNRAAGNGFWKATGADKKIYRDGKSVGSKKCLVFYQGKPKQSNKTTWIMHEYVADRPQRPRRLPNGTDDMRLDDCVLCRIYKKSEHSPKEEKEAGASESGETAKPEARKSSENNKQAVPKRVKTTNQQLNHLVLHRNLQMQQQDHPVIQPSLPTPQQNQQVMQRSLRLWSNNLGGQLDFPMQSNPEEGQPIMQQPNIPTSQQNLQVIMHNSLQPWGYNPGGQLYFHMERNPEDVQSIMQASLLTPQLNSQAIMQYSPQPWSNNLCGRLDFRQRCNPEEAQPIMPQPNLLTPLRNLQATQYSTLQAGSRDLGGQLYFAMESIPEEVNQFNFGNLGNSHETVGDLIPIDTVGDLTYPPAFQNGFSYNDIYHLPPMDSLDPIPPLLDNNDHPQNGSLIQRDELVFPKAGTSGNAFNP